MTSIPFSGLFFLISTAVSLAACVSSPEASTTTEQPRPGPDTTFYQEASWSPDGGRLLLSRLDIHDGYRRSLAVVRIDGSGYTRLTMGPADMWASWSPDGARIVYGSQKDDNRDIYVMNADGSEPIRLTVDSGENNHPHWSPDGSKIVFTSNREGTIQLFTMNADGSKQTRITQSPEEKWNPRWSPDGQKITYYGAVESGKDSVYVIHADGTGKRALTAGVWPSWSPDGMRILFEREGDVFQVDANGGAPGEVMTDAVIARWSPDGTRIAFVRRTWVADSGWPATTDVFISNADGSGAINVTNDS